MGKYPTLFSLLILAGCGLYGGSEGVYYNPDTYTGFRTPEYDASVKEMKVKIEAMGEEVPDLPDNAVTIVDQEQVEEATGGVLTTLAPFAPFGTGFILLLISHFVTRRKKRV